MIGLLILAGAGAIALAIWRVVEERRYRRRSRRRRKSHRFWSTYSKAWQDVFVRSRVRRITFHETADDAVD